MIGEESTPPATDRQFKQQVQAALKQVALTAGQTVIVARGPQVVAHRGELKLTEAQDIAGHVSNGWQERGQTARIQFMRLPLLADERLLYTQPLSAGFLLTIVERAEVPLSRSSQLARQLLPLLETAGLTRYNTAP